MSPRSGLRVGVKPHEARDLTLGYAYPPVASLLRIRLREDDCADDLPADEPPDGIVSPTHDASEFLHRQIPFGLAGIHKHPPWWIPPPFRESRERRPALASANRF